MREFRAGDIFEYEKGDGVLNECIRITPASAIVRPLARKREVIKDIQDNVIAEFDKPYATQAISLRSIVHIVKEGPDLTPDRSKWKRVYP